ncbi:MAG TPA: transporter substrate-binding domain-containing protein [Candidatus Limnocylindrales bacterium]|nr:transporter substrate-binding domain-containing protein [Candidatus Limnocylindrales bacterium]
MRAAIPITLLLFLAGCGGPTQSASRVSTLDRILETKVLRVGVNPGYAPFEMVDTQGNMIGFDVDVARYVADQMGNGVRVEFQKSDWDPIIANLNAGKFDVIVSGMTRTPQRALRCDFTDPYFETGQALLVNSAKHKNSPGLSVRDFDRAGVIVATKLGTTGEIAARKFFKKASIKTMETESDCALEVDAGRADIMVYDKPYIAIRAQESRARTFALLDPFTKEYLAMAVRKGDTELRDWLNLTLFELKTSGTWDSLYQTWFVRMPWLDRVKRPSS